RESEWIPGWEYQLVFSHSGLAEKDCVFLTRQAGEAPTVWVNSLHDPQELKVEYIRITPGIRVVRLRIELTPLPAGSTRMVFGFAHTALGEAGNREVDRLNAENGREFEQLGQRLATLLERFFRHDPVLE
ncbi:MAG TPA: hypothetical protein PKK12_05225, partial [Candidatus Aminicenantes bacterium]|nr:hypothetical protein [Candidatus Aminicenantes bacterium]